VCHGRSNPEIGARLFLSACIVEWHLRKVLAKLGIHSRNELARALSVAGSALFLRLSYDCPASAVGQSDRR
jgi:DNA-binding CsgD family transcriptional regulator